MNVTPEEALNNTEEEMSNLYMARRPVPAIQWTGHNTKNVIDFIKRRKNEINKISEMYVQLVVNATSGEYGETTKFGITFEDTEYILEAVIGDYIMINDDIEDVYALDEASFKKGFASIIEK